TRTPAPRCCSGCASRRMPCLPSIRPHARRQQGPPADPLLRVVVGLHRDPRQADHPARAAAGVVAHAAGDGRAAADAAGVALHWLTFYAAIKLANASVGATCIALGPVFLAFVEPWIAKRRFDPRELLI